MTWARLSFAEHSRRQYGVFGWQGYLWDGVANVEGSQVRGRKGCPAQPEGDVGSCGEGLGRDYRNSSPVVC